MITSDNLFSSDVTILPVYLPYHIFSVAENKSLGFRFDNALHKCEPVTRESKKNSYLNL